MKNVSQQLVKYAEERGFALVRKTKHIVMRRGSTTITIPKSASDWRAAMNARKDIDRALRTGFNKQ